MADEQMDGGVVRNSQSRALAVFLGIFALLVLVFVGIDGDHIVSRLLGYVLFPLLVIAASRTAQSSIKWTRQGIVARGTVTTRRLAWSQIAGFEHREVGGLGARLRDGRWVRLLPYPRSRFNKPEQATATLEAARQAAGKPPDHMGGPSR